MPDVIQDGKEEIRVFIIPERSQVPEHTQCEEPFPFFLGIRIIYPVADQEIHKGSGNEEKNKHSACLIIKIKGEYQQVPCAELHLLDDKLIEDQQNKEKDKEEHAVEKQWSMNIINEERKQVVNPVVQHRMHTPARWNRGEGNPAHDIPLH